MKIESVSFSEKGQYVTLRLSGIKNSLVITSALYGELDSPGRGEDISDSVYERILSADEYYRATVRALRILSYSDNSRRRLYEKLRQKGICRDTAERVADDMSSLGYLDEKKQLRTLILRLANESLLGPYKMMAKLSGAGYPSSDIRAVISELRESGEVDFEENLKRLVQTRLGEVYGADELRVIKYKWGYIR